jgi:hypothetical protein
MIELEPVDHIQLTILVDNLTDALLVGRVEGRRSARRSLPGRLRAVRSRNHDRALNGGGTIGVCRRDSRA